MADSRASRTPEGAARPNTLVHDAATRAWGEYATTLEQRVEEADETLRAYHREFPCPDCGSVLLGSPAHDSPDCPSCAYFNDYGVSA